MLSLFSSYIIEIFIIAKSFDSLGENTMSNIKEAREIIQNMNDYKFIKFQHELQYAMKYHDVGYDVAQSTCMLNDRAEYSRQSGAISGTTTHPMKRDEVIQSPLYQIVRDELKRRLGDNVPSNWCGWVGYHEQQQVDHIANNLTIVFKNKYPVVGLLGAGVSDEVAEQAQASLGALGFKGTFVESENLLETFLENYKSN